MIRLTEQDVLALIRDRGVVRPCDLEAEGVSRMWLTRLERAGQVERVGRGLYRSSDAMFTENHGLVLAAKAVPGGIVCLLSALQFHELTTQLPSEVWLAIDGRAARPRVQGVPLRIVRFSGTALSLGVEEHMLEGVTARVYSAPKTVVDCFRYRNKIGFDVALEALRDCYRQRRATIDELWRCANQLRMANVMRPYLESLL